MRVQSQPIVTGYSNNNTPAFKSAFLYSPRSPLHKINPVLRFMDYNFERSLQASRSMWFAVNKKLAPYVTIVDKTNNKFNTKMWDINKNNTKYLIIMHGLSHNITSLQTLYQEILDKTNYAVLAPEYNGFEQNSKENVYLEPKNLIKTTDVAIQYLNSKGIKDNDIYILGHSFGGYVAAACAKKHQNIGGLILLSSINTHKHWADAIKNGSVEYIVIDDFMNNNRTSKKRAPKYQKLQDTIADVAADAKLLIETKADARFMSVSAASIISTYFEQLYLRHLSEILLTVHGVDIKVPDGPINEKVRSFIKYLKANGHDEFFYEYAKVSYVKNL